MSNTHPLGAELAAKAVGLYVTEKVSSIEVARRLGCSKAWVLRQVRRAGVVRTSRAAFAISPVHGHALRKSGAAAMAWRGGRKFHANGYVQVMVKGHPAADRFGYVLEHRLIMERHIGRYLVRGEDVHHKNGIRDDNQLDNLELLTHSEHMSVHAKERTRLPVGTFGKGRKQA